jgi:hypothetical protein
MAELNDLILPVPALLIAGPETTRAVLGDMAYSMGRGRDFKPNAPVYIKTPDGVKVLRPRGDIEAAELEERALQLLEESNG